MTTAVPSAALATIQPAFTDAERVALAGFLAGYRGLTREAYALDLRQFTTWCRARSLPLFSVRRADIEGFARDLEARGRARATVTRRLCTIAGFYKYAVEEEFLEYSSAAHVRRPRVDYESHAVALDRNELGALLVSAGLGSAPEHRRRVYRGCRPVIRGLAANPPGRHSRQADSRWPSEDKVRKAVTDRDQNVNANRRYARLTGYDGGTGDGTQSWAVCAGGPGQRGDRVPGRGGHAPRPGVFAPAVLAGRAGKTGAAGPLASRRFPFPGVA